MAEHIVRRGDTLWGIAQANHIRYWPNLYFATENNEFRETHPNPDLIFPGDRVGIPSRESIAPMDEHPVKVHRRIPLFTQSAETCWRATGKMLFLRQHAGQDEAGFNRSIGSRYQELETGLASEEWTDFYVARLGMTETTIASPNDLHRIVATRGPVVAAIGDGTSAHSMILTGYDLFRGRWFVLDPAAGQSMTFEEDTGSTGPARLSDFHTGPATWDNMGRWLWIMDTTIHERIFHF